MGGMILPILTIVAIVAGPILALQIQRRLDASRETRNRKLQVFKTLMSARVTRLSPTYVQALNLIDVEFTDKKEKGVRDAWRELNDLYSSWTNTTNAAEKADELNAILLTVMGKRLGYDFDKVYLKKGAYYPQFLVNLELEQHKMRELFLELLDGTGKRKLPVAVFEQTFPDLADQPGEEGSHADGN